MKFVILDLEPALGFETFFMTEEEYQRSYPTVTKRYAWEVKEYYPALNVCSLISPDDEEILDWYFIGEEDRAQWVRETRTIEQQKAFLAECTGTCPKIIEDNGFCQEDYFPKEEEWT
jgi:hypothetical protein